VHVGKHQGLELCELDQAAVCGLHENWLPIGKALVKPLKADRELIAALEKAAEEFGLTKPAATESDELPY
jgi:hypothetical protein